MFNNKEGYLKEMHCFVSRDAFFPGFLSSPNICVSEF